MLRTQYRMHPHIREFPSREFYAEALQDGEEMAEKTSRPWHAHPALGPLTFVNVEGEQYHPEGTNSWANDDEAAVILLLVKQFLRYGEAVLQEGGGLAVVSPYKAQVRVVLLCCCVVRLCVCVGLRVFALLASPLGSQNSCSRLAPPPSPLCPRPRSTPPPPHTHNHHPITTQSSHNHESNHQVANVKQKLLAEFGERTAELIDVNTIDGFQVGARVSCSIVCLTCSIGSESCSMCAVALERERMCLLILWVWGVGGGEPSTSEESLCSNNPLLSNTQGREKDVVIFSVVRAPQGAGRSIGFVADERRVARGNAHPNAPHSSSAREACGV